MKPPIEMPVINLNSPNSAEELKNALRLKEGDTIEIVTPQFDRVDNVLVAVPEKDEKFFNAISTFSDLQLEELGLQKWDETEKGCLWLFPFQWYNSIPDGFEITVIDGRTEPFAKGITDDDMRFGALAYGIMKVNHD